MVVSSFATISHVDADIVAPVIDFGRLRQIMESVRRLSEGDGVANANPNAFSGTELGPSHVEEPLQMNMEVATTTHTTTTPMSFEPDMDIESSRSPSPSGSIATVDSECILEDRQYAYTNKDFAHASTSSERMSYPTR